MTNLEKGLNYEIFIKNYLINKNQENNAWLWKDIPELELRKCNILGNWNEYRIKRKNSKYNNELIDTGCDILLKNSGKYYIIQCKNYDITNSIKIQDLSGFYMMMIHYDLDGKLYYTSKLSHNIISQKNTNKIEYIKKNFESENDDKNKYNNYSNLIDKAFDYQIEASNKINNIFLSKNRAILQLPCGMGKTLISMIIGLNYDQVIIISPLKQYCVQNLEKFKSELKYNEYEGLIIDSDGIRDITYVENFIKNNKKVLLSICYKSCDILEKILYKLNNYIIIIDEFHNLSKNDLIVEENKNKLYEILNSDSKILFMSATPKIFDFEYIEEEGDNEKKYNTIFGEIEYLYNMGDAIKNNKICDYEIYIPDIEINNNNFINDISNEINIHNLTKDIIIKSNFILRGMLEVGARKCILYAKNHEESYQFKNTLNEINNYFALDIYVETLLSNDNLKERKLKLKSFSEFNGLSIIINVEILNECIDIKECDSIFITYPSQSKIKNIQRLCRANRKDINNINKISRIFLWLEEYDEMVDFIKHLKEFDNTFLLNKINIFSLNDNKNQILSRNHNSKKYELLDNFILNIKIVLSWEEKFENLIKYINKYGSIPSISDNNNDNDYKYLAKWYQNQKFSYINKTKMMKHKKYYDIWTKFIEDYPKYFLNHTEKWINKLNDVKNFININKTSPSRYSKNEYEKDLGSWIASQKENCNKNKKMFSHENIIKIWNNFLLEFKKYLLNNDEKWYDKFDNLEKYIEENGKLPVHKQSEKDSLGLWVITQNKNYKKMSQIMEKKEIYELWTYFLKKNYLLFLTKEDIWNNDLILVKEFIDKNGNRPKKNTEDIEEKRLGNWLVHQLQNFKYNKNNMKDCNIRNKFESFYEKYKKYI
jgi:superfamily II DNA or RNA helicase